jgi:hypothetical protein
MVPAPTMIASDAAIQGGGALGDDERPARAAVFDEGLVEFAGLLLAHPANGLDPSGLQELDPAPCHLRVGVAHADDDAPQPRLGDLTGTRRRAAGMVAGLEVDVKRGASRGIAGGVDRMHLGMRPAGGLVVALADHDPVPDHDRAHHGIGRCEPPALRRQAEGQLHEVFVVHSRNSPNRAPHPSSAIEGNAVQRRRR